MTTPRGVTSMDELRIEWEHPIWAEDRTAAEGETRVLEPRSARPVDEVYAHIAGDDPRPLLILRECLTCTGTDDALLTRQADNEKTMLMSRWFRCVKLPPDVLEQDHAFRALFTGDAPAHLFLARKDGSQRVDLEGDQSRAELWKAMEKVLANSYVDSPRTPLGKLFRILDRYDELDREITLLKKRIDTEVEKNGPESGKFRKLQNRLVRLREEHAELRDDAEQVSALTFREPERS